MGVCFVSAGVRAEGVRSWVACDVRAWCKGVVSWCIEFWGGTSVRGCLGADSAMAAPNPRMRCVLAAAWPPHTSNVTTQESCHAAWKVTTVAGKAAPAGSQFQWSSCRGQESWRRRPRRGRCVDAATLQAQERFTFLPRRDEVFRKDLVWVEDVLRRMTDNSRGLAHWPNLIRPLF